MPYDEGNHINWKFSKKEGVYIVYHVPGDISTYTFAGNMIKDGTATAFATSASYNTGTGKTDIVFYIADTTTDDLETGEYEYTHKWYTTGATYKPIRVWGTVRLDKDSDE